MSTNDFLEQFYENVILPRYNEVLALGKIRWKDHGKIDLDAWAHYFEGETGREYVLLWEDFPGNTYLDDELSHEVVMVGDEINLKLSFSDNKEIANITGYFTLYREKV